MKKRWEISRRTFLGGAASLIALPLLEQMTSSRGRAYAGAAPAGRAVFLHWPTGVCPKPGAFQPTTPAGGNLSVAQLSPILAPLGAAGLVGDTTIITGLANKTAEAAQAGDHARGTGAFLTCTLPPPQIAPLQNGVSVDVLIAQALGQGMRLPGGLQLGTRGGGGSGQDCDSGYSCAYQFNTSWGPNSTPIPEEDNPRNAFNRVFAGYSPGATAADVQKRLKYKTSVLDYARDQATRLRGKLNPRDSAKVDEYLTAVRDFETRLQAAAAAPQCTPGDMPTDKPADIREHVRLMLDLTVLTLQCDVTPVVTFSYEHTVSEIQHTFLTTLDGKPVTDGYHIGITHHQGDPFKLDEYQAVNTWMYSQAAYLVGKLKGVTLPDGSTLLDRTMVFSGTEMGDGNAHNHRQLKLALFGGKSLGLQPGRHVVVPDPTPLSNLYLTMMQKLQVPNVTQFGDSTGTLAL